MSSRHSEYADTAVKRLAMQGFVLASQPSEVTMVLEDVTELDDTALVQEFTLLTAWADYAYAQLALASIEEREAERGLAVAEAHHWDKPKTLKTSVSEAKALVSLDKGVEDAQHDLDKIYAYRKLLGEMAARYERDAAVLSRELTRRTSNGLQSRKARFTP